MAIRPFVKDNPNELNRKLFWQYIAVGLSLSKFDPKIEKKTNFSGFNI